MNNMQQHEHNFVHMCKNMTQAKNMFILTTEGFNFLLQPFK